MPKTHRNVFISHSIPGIIAASSIGLVVANRFPFDLVVEDVLVVVSVSLLTLSRLMRGSLKREVGSVIYLLSDIISIVNKLN